MVEEAKIKITADSEEVLKEMGKLKSESKSLQDSLSSAAKVSGVAFAGFTATIGVAVAKAAKFEQIGVQFEVLTGSIKTSQKALADLKDFSAATPFQFEDVANAGRILLSFGTEVDNLTPRLQVIGDVAAASGANFKELATIFGQVQAAGKLTGERLLQFQERGIPILDALAVQLNITKAEVKDFVSAGKVGFKDFSAAFNSLNKEGGPAFQGLIKQSKTLGGVLSTLGDNFDLLLVDVGQQFLPIVKQAALGFIGFIQAVRENKELVTAGVRILAAGAAITGLITTLALGAIAFSKLTVAVTLFKTILAATQLGTLTSGMAAAAPLTAKLATGLTFLSVKLGITRIAAALLVGTLTLGLGAVIAFLPEIISFGKKIADEFTRIAGAVGGASEQIKTTFVNLFTSIGDIASNVGILLAKVFTFKFGEVANAAANVKASIDQAIDQAFSDVKDVKRAITVEAEEVEAGGDDEAAAEERIRKKEEARKAEAARLAIIDAENAVAAKERTKLQQEELALLRQQGTENLVALKQEEIKLLEDLESAKNARDREKASIALENFREQEAERRAVLIEERTIEQEELAEFEEVQKERKAEENAIEDEGERERFAANSARRSAAERAVAKERSTARKKEQNQQLKEEVKFGKTRAQLMAFMRRDDVKGAQMAANDLVALENSKNNTLKSVGKAAAITQITMRTAATAINVYNSLSLIPIVGPVLGAAAALAVIAFGAEQIQTARRAQAGGVVDNISEIPGVGRGDRIPILTEPGEIIIPRPLAPAFSEQFALDADRRGLEQPSINITIPGTVIGTQEFTEQELIPSIREAVLNANADLGIEEGV